MSDRGLTLPKLLKALKNVDNWFWFESKYQKDPDRCKIDMLQYWLNNESEPTWSYVVHALEDANHRALAAQIRREFIEDRVTETGVEQHSVGAIASSISLTTIQQTGVEQEQSTAASVERLESDQVDLRARLQCCEQDLKTATSLRMKERAIVAAQTDVEERISHLKMELLRKEFEDLKDEIKSHLKKNEETVAKKNSQTESAQADMMAAGHRRDSDIEELKMKVEKLTKEGEDSKSNHQPQSSVDSTYQLVGKRNTLEAAERNISRDSVNRHKKSRQTELNPEIAPSVSQFQAKQTAVGHPKLEVLVFGKTGVGKSSLINSILGREIVYVYRAFSEECLANTTLTTMQVSLTVGNSMEFSIHDCPGLRDDGEDDNKYLEDIYSNCKDVDVLLFCVSMTDSRFSSQEQHAIGLINKKFGPTIWERCVLVLTKANLVYVPRARRETSSAIIEYHQNVFRSLREKFCSCLKKQGVSASVCKGLQVVAAGNNNCELERDDCNDRLIVFASEHSMADPGPPLQRVDFIIELWVACLKTVPEASRIRYLQAIAQGGHIKEDEKPAGYLSQIEMAAIGLDKSIQSAEVHVHVGGRPKTDHKSDHTCCLL